MLAQIAKYINLLYEDVFQDWSRKNDHRIMEIARRACVLNRFRKEKMSPGATMLEAFADFRDWRESTADEASAFEQQFTEGEVLRFLKDPATNKEVRNIAFGYFKPEEYPPHRMLQELMALDASGADRDQIVEIAPLLLPWCRDGNYGALFDGTSNLSLTGKIAHFELGYIPDAAKELRASTNIIEGILKHSRKPQLMETV